MTGKWCGNPPASRPSRIFQSTGFMPAARMRTRTPSGATGGGSTSTSSSFSRPPHSLTAMARMCGEYEGRTALVGKGSGDRQRRPMPDATGSVDVDRLYDRERRRVSEVRCAVDVDGHPIPLPQCRSSSRRSGRNELPAIVREGLVRLRHAEDVVLALVSPALLRLR